MEEPSTFGALVNKAVGFPSLSLGLFVKRPPPYGLVSAVSNNPPVFLG